MKRRTLFQAILVMVLLLLLVSSFNQAQQPEAADAVVSALGTAFTYQGQLAYNGAPVNDTCDFTFSLWDAADSGNQVASNAVHNGVAVSDGLFTVSLDFGSDAFIGDARWLQIYVDCSSISTTLSPAATANPRSLCPGPAGVVHPSKRHQPQPHRMLQW